MSSIPRPEGTPRKVESLHDFSWDKEIGEDTARKLPEPDSYGLNFEEDEDEPSSEFIREDEDPASGGVVLPDTNSGLEDIDVSTSNISINALLKDMMALGASDLHLSAEDAPSLRINGDMTRMEGYPRLSSTQIEAALSGIMTEEQRNRFDDELELDFAHSVNNLARFRVNVFKQQRSFGAVFRAIPWEIKSTEDLGIPEVVSSFSELKNGLVLVTGPTGSGKSTTLAAIVDRVNRMRADHIITIEDPVEFLHPSKSCIVNQREVGVDTLSFANALKRALRQDPDVILVGELRDLETIQLAITAAETGHLVFGTLHTQSAQDTVNRIVDVFPDATKEQIRTQLATSLRAVVCQTLLKKKGGGRRAAMEIMVVSDAIANQIAKNSRGIQSSIQTGKPLGMQTMDDALLDLVKSGEVHWSEAIKKASDRAEFEQKLGGRAGIESYEKRWAADRKTPGW